MAKSARNTTEIAQLRELGIDPLAFRYQALMTHYRARMHFTLAALRQAAEGLDHLRQRVRHLVQLAPPDLMARGATAPFTADAPPAIRSREWIDRFRARVHDDLDLPGALAVAQACIADASTGLADRLSALLAMDGVLGLDLAAVARERETRPRRSARSPTSGSANEALCVCGTPMRCERVSTAGAWTITADPLCSSRTPGGAWAGAIAHGSPPARSSPTGVRAGDRFVVRRDRVARVPG